MLEAICHDLREMKQVISDLQAKLFDRNVERTEYLTHLEVCSEFKINRSNLYKISTTELPKMKVGKTLLYRRKDVMAWLESKFLKN